MTTLSEVQFPSQRMLLCQGGLQHAADVPNVRDAYGVTGPVVCSECGAPMSLIDVVVVDRAATWALLCDDPRGRLYTTAKLHPLALLAGLNREGRA